MFITLDGIDGGGKSTQIQLLASWLTAQGYRVQTHRDPGSTKLGTAVREILLHREDIPLANTTEMLLYMAARAQLVSENIRPALQAGETIVCDRFLLANVVYQGSAGGLDVEDLWRVGQIATAGCMPELTIVLDIDPEIAASRIQRGQDRLEKRGIAYFQKVRAGFIEQLPRCGGTTAMIDANCDVQTIHKQIIDMVQKQIDAKNTR
ncbi:MAG: dTMP kinase [Planctomycetota bacterium]|jgi:dTMP kinase|nr:dTMP kinase [Planctomycetaceae bacterium]MCE2813896.1 dTMP kinase [Planctomycetaceae bacterium]